MKIYQCNPLYKYTETKKYDHLIRYWKSIRQNLTPLGEIRDTRNVSKHNKSNIQQADSQHQIKWRKTQSDSTKVRNKTRLSTLSIFIQHSSWSSGYSNKTTKGDQGNSNWKWRSQAIVICRWYDSIHKWSQKLYQGTPTTDIFSNVTGYKINSKNEQPANTQIIKGLRKKSEKHHLSQ